MKTYGYLNSIKRAEPSLSELVGFKLSSKNKACDTEYPKAYRYSPVCAYDTGTFHMLKWAETEAKYFPKASGRMNQR